MLKARDWGFIYFRDIMFRLVDLSKCNGGVIVK